MQGREMKAVEEDKQEKRYTWRHRWKQDDEYQVFARSRGEAMKIAIERFFSDDSPDDSRVIQDTWTLMEVEDD